MSDDAAQKIICARIEGSQQTIRAFLDRNRTEPNAVQLAGDRVIVEVFVPEQVLDQLDTKQVQVTVLYDASARGRERQKEVGQGNRFEGQRGTFQGLGVKAKEEPR